MPYSSENGNNSTFLIGDELGAKSTKAKRIGKRVIMNYNRISE
jgi:hypothetical protein